jgi:hypothetical protein
MFSGCTMKKLEITIIEQNLLITKSLATIIRSKSAKTGEKETMFGKIMLIRT